ncbi:MAG: type II toxin-antitoxin system VapC family toxin [Candidatus Solibacter sp.]
MAILVDSDILIEVTRGRDAGILKFWHELGDSNEVVMCSPVTVAELWHGARPAELQPLGELFDSLEVITMDRHTGRLAGEILKKYSKSHGVELGDALIAATSIQCEARLWTRNRKQYPMPSIRFFDA